MSTTTPQKCASESEATAVVPPGTAERFSGYALMGMAFDTGYYLAYRRFPASSIGPGYHAVWLRRPDGHWSIYSDVPPEFNCARYFGAAFGAKIAAPVTSTFTGAFDLTITVPGILDWRIRLESSMATAGLGTMARKMPAAMWSSDKILGAMGLMMGPILGSGKMALAGLVPNGQSFRAHPRRVWMVKSAQATINGHDAGVPQALPIQEHLADFWLPQRGIFVAGLDIEFPSTASTVGAGVRPGDGL